MKKYAAPIGFIILLFLAILPDLNWFGLSGLGSEMTQPVAGQQTTSHSVNEFGLTTTELTLVVIAVVAMMYLTASVLFAKMGAGKISPIILALPYGAAILVTSPLLAIALVLGPFILVLVGFRLFLNSGMEVGEKSETLVVETPNGRVAVQQTATGLHRPRKPLLQPGDVEKLIGPQGLQQQLEESRQRRIT